MQIPLYFVLFWHTYIYIYLRKGDFAESYVKLQYRRVYIGVGCSFKSTSQRTTLHRIDSHEQRKKCGKTSPGPIPLGFTQGGLHFLLKKKNPVSTTCRSTADFIKIQPKRRLKHCKPNQYYYKPSHLGHLSGVPPKLGDLRSPWLRT